MAGVLLLAACSTVEAPSEASAVLTVKPGGVAGGVAQVVASAAAVGAPKPATPVVGSVPVTDWEAFRIDAARRMLFANPDLTYLADPPARLLAIPVLDIELHADGSIERIVVVRFPRQATETVQIAINAVQRAAPFGNMTGLSQPWRFTETFLFNDDRKFLPRSLDEAR